MSAPDLAEATPIRPVERRLTSDITVVIEPRGIGFGARLREIWNSRHLMSYLARQAIRRLYRNTVLGWIWILIRALLPVVVNTIIFSELAGVKTGSDVPYILFMMVGMTIWSVFSLSLTWATRGLQLYSGLLTKLYFPRLILPFVATAPAFIFLGINLGLSIAFALYFLWQSGTFYLTLGPSLIWALAAILLAFLFALGLGFWTSVLAGSTRDVRFTVGMILPFWMYLTPVAYPAERFSEGLRWLLYVNPMALVVELFRVGTLGSPFVADPLQIATTLGIIAVALGSGLWYFIATEAITIDKL